MDSPFLEKAFKKVKGNKILSFLFFLLVSCSLWLSLTLNRVYEANISVCVHIVGIPDNVKLVDGDEVEVCAFVEGYGTDLIGYVFDDDVEVTVGYADFVRSGGNLAIPVGTIKGQVAAALKTTVSLCGFSVDSLRTAVQSASVKVPVVKDIKRLVTSQGCELVSHKYSHDSVMVTAYVDILPSIKAVNTEPLVCNGLAGDSVFELDIMPGPYVCVSPKTVKVHADVSRYVEKETKVYVEYAEFPSDFRLHLLPSEAIVKYDVLEINSEKVNATDFSVKLRYKDCLDYMEDGSCSVAAIMDRFRVACMSPYVGECSLLPLDLSGALDVLNKYHNDTCNNGYYW